MDFSKYFVKITIVISIFLISFGASMIVTSSTISGSLMNDSQIPNIIPPEMTVILYVVERYNTPDFMEGSDVHFECVVMADTEVTQFEWYHNYEKIHPCDGISMLNSTLVLQKISKTSRGKYFCKATNVRGSVASNEMYLDVKYAPICNLESTVIFAIIKQVMNLTCLVDSNPSRNLDFKWKFNNSSGNGVELLPMLLKQLSTTGKDGSKFVNPNLIKDYVLSKNSNDSNMIVLEMGSLEERLWLYEQKGDIRTSGKLTLSNIYQYSIESSEDFGIVWCVASNQWGQSQPCWYYIIPADYPDPVKNCTAYNATSYSVQVKCITGYDGGIQQQFNVQVYDELYQQIVYNMTYEHSQFEVKKLQSGSAFVLRITSINLRGPSKSAYQLTVRTLSANSCSSEVLLRLIEPVFALLGLLVVINILGIAILIFLSYRKHYIRRLNGSAMVIADKKSVESLSVNIDANTDRRPSESSAEEFCTQEEPINPFRKDFRSILQPTFGQPRQPTIPPLHKNNASVTTNPITKPCNTPTDFGTRSFPTASFDSSIPLRVQLENVDDSPGYVSMESFKSLVPLYSTILRKNKSEMSLSTKSSNNTLKASVSQETLKSVCVTDSP